MAEIRINFGGSSSVELDARSDSMRPRRREDAKADAKSMSVILSGARTRAQSKDLASNAGEPLALSKLHRHSRLDPSTSASTPALRMTAAFSPSRLSSRLRAFAVAFFVLTMAIFTSPGQAADTEGCLTCHQYRGLSRIGPDGK